MSETLLEYLICYILGDIEFTRLILREVGRWIAGTIYFDTMVHNIKWLQWGGYEFEQIIKHLNDIPSEVAFSFINHAHECIYKEG